MIGRPSPERQESGAGWWDGLGVGAHRVQGVRVVKGGLKDPLQLRLNMALVLRELWEISETRLARTSEWSPISGVRV